MPFDFKILEKNLSKRTNLKQLDLSGSELTDEDLLNVINAIKKNSSLTELKLDDNLITTAGLAMLVDFLRTNNTLERISLNNNRFEAEAAKNKIHLEVIYKKCLHNISVHDFCRDLNKRVALANSLLLNDNDVHLYKELCGQAKDLWQAGYDEAQYIGS